MWIVCYIHSLVLFDELAHLVPFSPKPHCFICFLPVIGGDRETQEKERVCQIKRDQMQVVMRYELHTWARSSPSLLNLRGK